MVRGVVEQSLCRVQALQLVDCGLLQRGSEADVKSLCWVQAFAGGVGGRSAYMVVEDSRMSCIASALGT
jgi:hypothetical protein